jgi:hypothetical protein
MKTTEQTLIESWRRVTKPRVQRNDESYQQCYEFHRQEIERYLDMYRTTVFAMDMRARLMRDQIEKLLRRHHEYTIEDRIKSHYNQLGVSLAPADCIGEHVIPVGDIRDMLIDGVITLNQALNPPMCRISRSHDKMLRDCGLHAANPEPWYFFRRYITAMLQDPAGVPNFETFNGQAITDLHNWSLQDHWNFFNIV